MMNRKYLFVFLMFLAISSFLAKEGRSDAVFNFEGTIDIISHEYKYHNFALPKDGLVTLTFAYSPKDAQGNDRKIWSKIGPPVPACSRGYGSPLYDGPGINGIIYGPFPAQAGSYEILLFSGTSPPYGDSYPYTVSINYTTSNPATADHDPTEGIAAWCLPDAFDDWATLRPGSSGYGHIGYRRCHVDDCDNYNFQVSESGRYQFAVYSSQADFTATKDDNGWSTCRPYASISTPDSGMKSVSLNLRRVKTNGDGLFVGWGDSVTLTKGVQYVVRMGVFGPPTIPSADEISAPASTYDQFYNKCYGALQFQLYHSRERFPLVLENVEYSMAFSCDTSGTISATVYNPNDFPSEGVVEYLVGCEQFSYKGEVAVSVPSDARKSTELRFDIPKQAKGKCKIIVVTDGFSQNTSLPEEYFRHEGKMDIVCGNLSFILNLLKSTD